MRWKDPFCCRFLQYRQQLTPEVPSRCKSFHPIPCFKMMMIPLTKASFRHRFRPNLFCLGVGNNSIRRLKIGCGTGSIFFVGSSPPSRSCLHFYLYINDLSTLLSFEMGLFAFDKIYTGEI